MDKEYFAGKGCTCCAYGESECGCGVDWTDPEVYELQAKVDKYEKALKLLANTDNYYEPLFDEIKIAREALKDIKQSADEKVVTDEEIKRETDLRR